MLPPSLAGSVSLPCCLTDRPSPQRRRRFAATGRTDSSNTLERTRRVGPAPPAHAVATSLPLGVKALRFVGRFSAGGVLADPEVVARPLRARRPLLMTEESGSIGGTVEARFPALPLPERTATMLARLQGPLAPPSLYPLKPAHEGVRTCVVPWILQR